MSTRTLLSPAALARPRGKAVYWTVFTGTVLLFVIASFLFERGVGLPRSVPFFMMVVLVFGLGGTRLAVRLL